MRATDFLDRLLLASLAFGAGVGLGVLLAPAPGNATRHRLSASARHAADRERIEQACTGFYAWCDELLARKRADPGEDVVSQLIAVEQEGDAEVVGAAPEERAVWL